MGKKPNAAGKAGAILNILVSIIVILIGILGLFLWSTVTTMDGWQVVQKVSFFWVIFWLIYLLFGVFILISSFRFMAGAGNKLSLGLISILTGVGLISGILILISTEEEE